MLLLLFASALTLQTTSAPALVGLWDFDGIAAEGQRPVTPITVYLNPTTSSAVVARLDKEGIVLADGSRRSCTWKRDLDVPASPRGCFFTDRTTRFHRSPYSRDKGPGCASRSTTTPPGLDGYSSAATFTRSSTWSLRTG